MSNDQSTFPAATLPAGGDLQEQHFFILTYARSQGLRGLFRGPLPSSSLIGLESVKC